MLVGKRREILQLRTKVDAGADGCDSVHERIAAGQAVADSEYKPGSLVKAEMRSGTTSAVQYCKNKQDQNAKMRRLGKK